jgi:hypothetical protein
MAVKRRPRGASMSRRAASYSTPKMDFIGLGKGLIGQIGEAGRNRQREDELGALQYIKALMESGGGLGGGGGGGARMGYGSIFDASGDIANMYNSRVGGINSAYQQALDHIAHQRGVSANEITASHGEFANAAQNSMNTYRSNAAGIDRSIRQDRDASQKSLQAAMNPIMADLAAQGVDNNALGQQLVGQQQLSKEAAQLQMDLDKRMRQTNESQHRDNVSSGAQVKHGAEGQLANNYSDITARIQAEKAKEIAAAEMARMQAEMENKRAVAAQRSEIDRFNASQRGSGGGGGMNPMEQALMMQKLQMGEMDLEAAKRGLAGDKPIDLKSIINKSGPVGAALLAGGGDPTESLRFLYSHGAESGWSDSQLSRYVNELLGKSRGLPSPKGLGMMSGWS